jgi:hypothetical protein
MDVFRYIRPYMITFGPTLSSSHPLPTHSENSFIGKWTRRFFEEGHEGQIGGKVTNEGFHEIDGRILAYLPPGDDDEDFAMWKNEHHDGEVTNQSTAHKSMQPSNAFRCSFSTRHRWRILRRLKSKTPSMPTRSNSRDLPRSIMDVTFCWGE